MKSLDQLFSKMSSRLRNGKRGTEKETGDVDPKQPESPGRSGGDGEKEKEKEKDSKKGGGRGTPGGGSADDNSDRKKRSTFSAGSSNTGSCSKSGRNKIDRDALRAPGGGPAEGPVELHEETWLAD